MTELMSNKGDCRTAPATQGLLKKVHTSPACFGVRPFQSCQEGCQLSWVVRVLIFYIGAILGGMFKHIV